MELKDFDRLGAYHADDITPELHQRPHDHRPRHDARRMVDVLGKVKSLAHPLIKVWREDDGVVILEVTSVWRFHDDIRHHRAAQIINTVLGENSCSTPATRDMGLFLGSARTS